MQDPVPHEDIVWGTLKRFASLSFIQIQRFADHRTAGIAFTIDPAYATEVRAYLGMIRIPDHARCAAVAAAAAPHLPFRTFQTTAKRYCGISLMPTRPPLTHSSPLRRRTVILSSVWTCTVSSMARTKRS